MSIVGVTASYMDYTGPYAWWEVFTIHVAALKKNNQSVQRITLLTSTC